ncbi:MAG: formate dehydrogenase accessory sulfurtransferase FdhD [Anaerolineae bacterium]
MSPSRCARPDADAELATGFLFAEGIIAAAGDVVYVTHCLEPEITAEQRGNVVTVTLRAGLAVDLAPLERHFTVSSACGVCGKAGIDQLAAARGGAGGGRRRPLTRPPRSAVARG